MKKINWLTTLFTVLGIFISSAAFATVPVFQSATTTSTTTIDIVYDIPIDFATTSADFITAFSATGVDKTGATASIAGSTVTVTLTVPVSADFTSSGLVVGAGTIKDFSTADLNAGVSGQTISDGIAPSITGVTPNIALITDSETGGTGFNITVTFDEPMIDDGSQDPVISFDNGGEDPSSTLTSESGTNWPDNQTFVVTYNVADANEVLADVDVLVSGGQDLAGNAITATNTDQNDLFSIDTQNPSITGVTPNIALITDSETGGTGFNITVTFDEPM
ncbi:hypothetical protein [Ekhidna sp.]|uniref:hypothetical protein n=1 Tax=Ekhidna sp. TaxID=2608089 RepID=UPI003B595953